MGEVPDESIYGLRAVSDEQRDSLEWTEERIAQMKAASEEATRFEGEAARNKKRRDQRAKTWLEKQKRERPVRALIEQLRFAESDCELIRKAAENLNRFEDKECQRLARSIERLLGRYVKEEERARQALIDTILDSAWEGREHD